MLDNAKITMDYKELKLLIDTAEEGKKYMKRCLELQKILEDKTERKVLDAICDILINATHSAKATKEKQKCITECIELYCNTFEIPIGELTEDE